MGGETKEREESVRDIPLGCFVSPIDATSRYLNGLPEKQRDAWYAALLADLDAYRNSHMLMSHNIRAAMDQSARLKGENESLRTELQEARGRCDRMRITMEQQTSDAVSLKAKIVSLEDQLRICRATIGRRGKR